MLAARRRLKKEGIRGSLDEEWALDVEEKVPMLPWLLDGGRPCDDVGGIGGGGGEEMATPFSKGVSAE